jgi:hypothetical protein
MATASETAAALALVARAKARANDPALRVRYGCGAPRLRFGVRQVRQDLQLLDELADTVLKLVQKEGE